MPHPAVLTTTLHCPDCGIPLGQEHLRLCDIARCLATGEQRLMCYMGNRHCGRDTWNGIWPGQNECVEFGWWTYFDGDSGGWQRCDASHSEAVPDCNRLILEAKWDREQQRWVKRNP